MPILGLPLLLVGLVALPMVAGIYWLRTRFRRQEVSALILWESAAQAQGGGRRRSRLQTPLALLLELLAILLLVLAATGPRVLRAGQTPAVVVVLDDSYSMQATDDRGVSARDRGAELVRRELAKLGRYTVRFVAAGAVPRVLGEAGGASGGASGGAEVEKLLERWQPEAPTADLAAGLALAGEVASPGARRLVVTDHPAGAEGSRGEGAEEEAALPAAGGAIEGDASEEGGRLRWVAVGRAAGNVGIVNAVRSAEAAGSGVGGSGGDVVMLEVANYAAGAGDGAATAATLTVSLEPERGEGAAEAVLTRRVEIAAGEVKRVWLRFGEDGLPEARGRAVVATLGDDGLAADNRVTLMPPPVEPLPVAVRVADAALRRAVERAVQASGKAELVDAGAQLVFADTGSGASGERWSVNFEAGEGDGDGAVQAYLGPFVVDHGHPAMGGVSLVGVVWAAATGGEGGGDGAQQRAAAESSSGGGASGGRPVVSTGDSVLLSDRERADGSHELTWRLRPERSTLLSSAAMPILIWNLIDWRRSERPGLTPVNARPGVAVTVRTTEPRGEVTVRRLNAGPGDDEPAADEARQTLAVSDRRAVIVPERPGVYEVTVNASAPRDTETPTTPDAAPRYRFAVNATSPTESDLTAAAAGETGEWLDQIALDNEYRGLAWALGLLALAVLGLHAWLVHRETSVASSVATTATTGGAA